MIILSSVSTLVTFLVQVIITFYFLVFLVVIMSAYSECSINKLVRLTTFRTHHIIGQFVVKEIIEKMV